MASLARNFWISYVLCVFFTNYCISLGNVVIQPNVEEKYVKHGATQELNCTADADTASAQLTWSDLPSVDGVIRESKSQTSDGISRIEAKLTIASFQSFHAGVYTCTYEDSTSTATDEIELIHIIETKKEPTFFVGNTSVTLGCVIDAGGRTIRSVEWLKADAPLSGSKYTVDSENQLAIKDPDYNDVGIYTARFQLTGATIPYDCEVAYKEEELQIVPKKTEAEYFYQNTTGTLACAINANGRPIKSVVWLKNGTAVSDLKDHERFEVHAGNLTIHDPTRDDAGIYTAKFTIEGIPEPYNCDLVYKAKPFVLDFDKSKNLIQEDNMELQCKVKGYPKAVVRWYKDSLPLNASTGEDKRIELKALNGYENARLQIRNVDFSDAGEYTCEAYSDFFDAADAKTITVRVKDKLAALWPFLGIVGEVIVLCIIIFIYEKRRNKQAEQEDNAAQEVKNGEKPSGVRHRGSKK